MALFSQPCFTSKSWGKKCNLLGSVLMFCRTNSCLLEELFHARFIFNFLLYVYIFEGVRVVLVEILMRGNISDSKDLSSVQRFLFLSPDFSACSSRLQEVLLGSFTCSRMLSECRMNVCSLSLGIAAGELPALQSPCKRQEQQRACDPAKPEEEQGAGSLSQHCRV